MIFFDPYDIWATPLGIAVRRRYYDGRFTGKLGAAGLSLLDWLLPGIARRIVSAKLLSYPIAVAHAVLLRKVANHPAESPKEILQHLDAMSIQRDGATAWGLGFPWMSKNGLYGSDIPFVTHTPYVMEALLVLAELPDLPDEAMTLFHGTWGFLLCTAVGHPVFLVYAPRRVACPARGVRVEAMPWASGKGHLTQAYAWFLVRWARRLSGKEVAQVFRTSWDSVFRSVEMAVEWGRAHQDLRGVQAIGIDEIAWKKGHRYLTRVYPIDRHCKRLLWVGAHRRVRTLLKFFRRFGAERSQGLKYLSRTWGNRI